MTVHLIRSVRDRQPNFAVKPNANFRFAALGNPINGFRNDLICGKPSSVSGVFRPTSAGVGVTTLKSTLTIGNVGQINGYTLIAVVSGDSVGDDNWIGADAGVRYFQLRAEAAGGASVQFICFDTSGNPYFAYAGYAGPQSANTFHVVIGTVGAGGFQTWSAEIGKSPVSNGAVAIASPKLIESYQNIFIGSRDSSVNVFGGTTLCYAVLPERINEQQAVSISKNPWQIFEPETIPLFFSTVTAQYARPASDVASGTWTASSGTDLYAMLDETAANDADYITTTSASTCEVALGSLSDPASSTGHIVRYRISSTGGGITVRLRQGTTTIASWTHSPAPTSLTTYEQTLSGAEADSITDYSALKLQFEAY